MFYLTLMNSLSYFAPSLFLFTVNIAMDAFRADVLTKVLGSAISDASHSQFYNAFVFTMDFIYVLLISSMIFFSLHFTNSYKKFKPYIYAVSTLFGFFAITVFIVLVVDVFRGLIDNAACNLNII